MRGRDIGVLGALICASTGPALADPPANPLIGSGALKAMQGSAAINRPLLGNAGVLSLIRRNGIPLAQVSGGQAASMSGWTRLTDGATQGGPTLYQKVGGETSIVVRAADGKVYVATVNPANPGGVIDGGAWVAISGKVSSEPSCTYGASLKTTACAWLDPKKNVIWGTMQYQYFWSENLLGPDEVGARPTIVLAESSTTQTYDKGYQPGTSRRVDVSVWTGSQNYLRHRETFTTDGKVYDTNYHEGLNVTRDTDWVAVPGTFSTPLYCFGTNCAAGVGNRVQSYEYTLYYNLNWKAVSDPTPPVPGGLSESAPVMLRLGSGDRIFVVRSKNGRIYQRPVYDAKAAWKDEGGFTKAKSNFDCIANNEQPTCFVQGDDGRIYWRKLSTASGL